MNKLKSYKLLTVGSNSQWDSEIVLYHNRHDIEVHYNSNYFSYSARHDFYFFALRDVRLKLEATGSFIVCNGSRIDVYPSGMSAIGTLGYILIFGVPADKTVEIFEPTEELAKIRTVEDQFQYRQKWIDSLINQS